ncbi:hypothetical protein B0H12DRAFT_305090 [Mycena haematopus]|nr:hypothetical protein B0H12DRAFT_305090 [Mycena haematopus]
MRLGFLAPPSTTLGSWARASGAVPTLQRCRPHTECALGCTGSAYSVECARSRNPSLYPRRVSRYHAEVSVEACAPPKLLRTSTSISLYFRIHPRRTRSRPRRSLLQRRNEYRPRGGASLAHIRRSASTPIGRSARISTARRIQDAQQA